MWVERKDNTLNDILAHLDEHYARFQHKHLNQFQQARVATEALSSDERTFVEGEVLRCLDDQRYYLENYHVIQTESEGLHTLYPFWDSQEIFYGMVKREQDEGRPVKIIVLKARQQGLSTMSQGLVFRKTIFTPVSNMLVVAQDPSQSDYLFNMSRVAYDTLPWWMRPERRYEAKGKFMVFDRLDDAERQSDPGLKSNIFVEAANKISGVARGKSIRSGHMSELSSWPDPTVLTSQIFPAMNAPDGIAIMESTAKGRDNFFYDLWVNAVNGRIDWVPCFIEFFRVTKYSLPPKTEFKLNEEEEGIRRKVEADSGVVLTDDQLNWRRSKIAQFIATEGSEWNFYAEYPIDWMQAFQASGLCAFNKKHLMHLQQTTVQRPRYTGTADLDGEMLKKGLVKASVKIKLKPVKDGDHLPPQEDFYSALHIWELPTEHDAYYVSCDTAEGIEGGDYSVININKIGRGQQPDTQVALWRGHINPTPFARVIYALGAYYNWAEVAVECNGSTGALTQNELIRTLEYETIYRWKHIDKLNNFITNYFGWWTTWKSKGQLVARGREAIDDKTVIIRSALTIDEMMAFTQLRSGGFGGSSNTHDDTVMAFLIGTYCAHESDWAIQAAQSTPDVDKKKKDFQNTDFSPVFDRNGPRQDMYRNGVPIHQITADTIEHVPSGFSGEDAWKCY